MSNLLKQQYQLIQKTRQALFTFFDELPQEKLHHTLDGFGSGSIMKTHIHVAECYLYWLGTFAMRKFEASFLSDEDVQKTNLMQLRQLFDHADDIVSQFIDAYDDRWEHSVENRVRWREEPLIVTPLWLLTHTETHEFHHKGQIVTMARQLGDVPPDTDLVL